MTGITHMVTGLYITSVVPNPLISLPLAFVSHFVLDFLPHNDYIYFYVGKFKFVHSSPLGRLTVIVGLGLVLFFALRSDQPVLLFLGAMIGAAPDIFTGLTNNLGLKDLSFNKLHRRLHIQTDLGEIFYNLKGGQIIHTEEMPTWRNNFLKMRKSLVANLGWLIGIVFEFIFLSVIIYKLTSYG